MKILYEKLYPWEQSNLFYTRKKNGLWLLGFFKNMLYFLGYFPHGIGQFLVKKKKKGIFIEFFLVCHENCKQTSLCPGSLFVFSLIKGLTLYPIFVCFYIAIPCQLLKIGIKLFVKKQKKLIARIINE